MRLLIVGDLEGHITTAGKIAISRGAKVSHVDTVDAALTALRSGRGRIARVEVSTDGGSSWMDAQLQGPVLPKCTTRFRHLGGKHDLR